MVQLHSFCLVLAHPLPAGDSTHLRRQRQSLFENKSRSHGLPANSHRMGCRHDWHYGAAHHPNLSDIQSDQILTIICRDIQQSSLFGYSLVVVLFAAILGALMSTADSCMLTLSSIVTKIFICAT